ncbi:MAG TPA: multicopper oxidase domain-containing protein [Gammaproteobacteria bacterium]
MNKRYLVAAAVAAGIAEVGFGIMPAIAAPVPGGTLDPTTIPKYVTPLVIPPVMNKTPGATGNHYDIAVRQFKQQILPTPLLPTTVWSYGPAQDPTPVTAPDPNSQFNYPAYTIENIANTPTYVNWINDLVANPDVCKTSANPANDPACHFLPHLLPVDRSLHWANPEKLPCTDPAKVTDCRPDPAVNGLKLQQPYDGPVPIVTHVHGAHVGPESDGYAEAWWLPAGVDETLYATRGTRVNQFGAIADTNVTPGMASFTYPNTQPSTTLWYHDHTLGMTRNNVYAGPAGFWLIRDAANGESGLVSGTLPGPAPVAGQGVLDLNTPGNTVRGAIREIPIVIQDRSFNKDGSLFYPSQRAFFQELRYNQLNMPYIGDPQFPSDIPAMWNPEAFFNVMVVNGVSWPKLEVEPDLYRFRLLNGCNSRFLNLAMFVVDANGQLTTTEVPFYQIGAEQGLLPKVVEVKTGSKTVLPGNGTIPAATPATSPEEALLMGLAERADVIVDFTGLAPGTRVRMVNTGPDSPFGGFPAVPVADPATTGQVMEFVVTGESEDPAHPTELFTAPADLVMSLPDATDPANYPGIIMVQDPMDPNQMVPNLRDMALLEEESTQVCVFVTPSGEINYDKGSVPNPDLPGTCLSKKGRPARSVPMAPKAAVLGINGAGGGAVTLWSDPIATNPELNETETWELWNWSADAHPIHLHLVKFKVVNREPFDPVSGSLGGELTIRPAEATEAGWKDTVIAYPGEVTRVNATFDIEGLYVWHCHIVEHEDNEMMVPMCVGNKDTAPGCQAVPPPVPAQ